MTVTTLVLVAILFITLNAVCTGVIKLERPLFSIATRWIAREAWPYYKLILYLAALAVGIGYMGLRAVTEPEYYWYLIPAATLGLPIAAFLYQAGRQNPSDRSF